MANILHLSGRIKACNMNDLTMQLACKAPDLVNLMYKLEGFEEAIDQLRTLEGKAAYVMYCTSVHLLMANVALNAGKQDLGPNDLLFHLQGTQIPDILSKDISLLDLINMGDLEDMYYATVAKHIQLSDEANTLLTHGFKAKNDIYFRFQKWDGTRLNELNALTLGEFQEVLAFQGTILFHPALKDLMEHEIYKKRARVLSQKVQTSDDQYKRHGIPFALANVRRCQDVRNMSSAMIYGELAEKHRSNSKAVVTPHSKTAYVSPYNLEERAKKLNVPEGANMPCICDSDCICAPLCASDPTQDCLCEENGLFARVTEGMDIDELDVPDLIRSKERSSEPEDESMTGSDTSSIPYTEFSASEAVHHADALSESLAPAHRVDQPEVDVTIQKEQRKKLTKDIALPFSSFPVMTDFVGVFADGAGASSNSAVRAWNQFSAGHTVVKPPSASSLSYRDALTQPFSTLCETPPRRMQRLSLAKRIFTTNSSARSQAEHSTETVATHTNEAGPGSGKLSKLVRKRTFADIDFAKLKRIR